MTRIAIAVLIAAAIGAAALLGMESRHLVMSTDDWFEEVVIDMNDYDLFDLGIADVNGDDNLDVFTTNHSARQSLLLGAGDWTFTEALAERKVSQDVEFPGLEDTLEEPSLDAPGLYIYRRDRWLTIRAHETDGPFRGTVSVPWPVEIRDAPSTVTVQDMPGGSVAASSLIRFELQASESLKLIGVDDIVEVPHRVTLADPVDLRQVFVGHRLINPSRPTFDLVWRDRHGFVFADLAGDEAADLYIARGGVKGQLDSLSVPVADELLIATGDEYIDRIGEHGFTKGNCPARQVAAVDTDGDGDLDLYVACGRSDVPDYPNQLFLQDDGQFVDDAAKLGLDYPTASVFAWLDADLDGDMDLLTLEDGRLLDYRYDDGRYARTEVTADLPVAAPYKLSVADYDNDGDLDAFAVYRRASYVAVNDDGRFRLVSAQSLGLPGGGRTANWVDYDNDGLLDLHVLPGGLYRQLGNGEFRRTGLAAYDVDVFDIVDARASWFDADNDGRQDAILAVKSGPTLWQRIRRKLLSAEPNLTDHWSSTAITARSPGNNRWLQVVLRGADGNREAIGARIYVTVGGVTQMRVVGGNDGAHFGQGHYRTYFGLAGNDEASLVRIVWPDGHEQRLGAVAADQLLHIARSEAG